MPGKLAENGVAGPVWDESTAYSAESVAAQHHSPALPLQELDNEDFLEFAQAAHELALAMLLNTPQLSLPFAPSIHYQRFSKTSFYCVDGFPKEGAPCAVVLPAPQREGYAYVGIRPSVVVLGKDVGNEVLEQLDLEDKSTMAKDAQRG